MVTINISNKTAYVLIGVLAIIVVAGLAIAWGSNNPELHGHDADEIVGGGGGDTFIRWGNSEAPTGTTLLYSGFAFERHPDEVVTLGVMCIKPGDPGTSASGFWNLRPLVTDTTGLPPGITSSKWIRCVVAYSPSPTVEIWGSSSCPPGWSAAYTGYTMAARGTTRFCADSNFDSTVTSPTTYIKSRGVHLTSTSGQQGYTDSRWIKCAVCVKD